CAELGVDEARDIQDFKKDLPDLLKKHETLHWFYGRNREMDSLVMDTSDKLLRRSRAGETGPSIIQHAGRLLHEMRSIKDADEIALIKLAVESTREAHERIMRETRPGMFEFTVEAMIQDCFRRHDAVEAYPSIVASGPNACVLHHISNRRLIQEGDLVLVDAGAELHCMNADVTRTYPAAEKFSPEQRDVYAIVLHAQKNAIARTIPGATLDDVHAGAVRDLVTGLLDLRVLTGSADENIEKGAFRKYYMHRTGHWLGLDVHDVGAYARNGKPRALEDGMICTVEPGLYFPPDSPERFRGIGVRIEDDVLVSGATPTVLTASIPKEIQDIEALRAS
ncbi:MAG TPA: M24B family metallopeptidase, partial [Leptospiraceae bacterium]|nr:M24B family metallopeptidase [Leptospiraceae bacterium]